MGQQCLTSNNIKPTRAANKKDTVMKARVNVVGQYIEEEGLAHLHDAKNRRAFTKILETYIEDNGKYRKVVEHVVQDLIEVFEEHMDKFKNLYENYGASNLQAPIHPLVVAVHLCQKYDFSGEDLVKHAIQLIVDHSNDGSCWFNFLSPFGNIRELHLNTLYPFHIVRKHNGVFVGEWITEAHLKALEYFLNNGKNIGSERLGYLLGLPDSYVRFTELPIKHRYFGHVTPLTLASLTGHPNGVLLLVRHGASPLYPASHHVPVSDSLRSPWIHPLHSLLNQLNLRAVDGEIEHLSLTDPEELRFSTNRGVSVTKVRQRKLLICLLYMLRVIAHPPIKIADEGQMVTREIRNGKAMLKRVYMKWIEQPFDAAPSLQHLCRCSIRGTLKESLQLPHGIQKLPVPSVIKHYLDLKC